MKTRTCSLILGVSLALVLICGCGKQGKEANVGKYAKMKMTKLEKLASKNDAEALFELGTRLHNGVPHDFKQSHQYFTQAAELGLAKAQYRVGLNYSIGNGIPQDYDQAFSWFKKAADQNHSRSQFLFGLMHVYGRGTAKNAEMGEPWLIKAAEQGDREAAYYLGYINCGDLEGALSAVIWSSYKVNEFEPKVRAYGLADLKDQPTGDFVDVYYMFLSGAAKKKTKSFETAAQWYLQAALSNHVYAQYALGHMYVFGKGVAKDKSAAYRWFRTAAENGFGGASHNIDALKGSLTSDLLAKLDTEVNSWLQTHTQKAFMAEITTREILDSGEYNWWQIE